MKVKFIIFLAITALVTLSFTFTNIGKSKQKVDKEATASSLNEEPAGGFVSEDKF
jgi:hypothetical protein